MEPYHVTWLSAHPHRSEDWLRERLREGFDIHHLDGDHGNNNPLNLVLIEHTDHMMLHGGRMLGRLGFIPKKGPRGPRKQRPPGKRVRMHAKRIRSVLEMNEEQIAAALAAYPLSMS